MKRLLIVLALLAASACSTVRPLPTTDSTKVEVRTETVTVHDTAYVELPIIIEKVQVIDTASTLENKFAKSEAIVSAGILSHSLETKPVTLPVKVETKIVYKDSLIFRDRIQTQTVEVEKKLTAWQKMKMNLGTVCLLIIALAIIYVIYLIVKHF